MKKNKHHRKPRFIGGTNAQRNISLVPRHKHHAWHALFGIMTPQEIAHEINTYWLDPSYKFIVQQK